MLDRRTFAKFAGATALSGLAAPALISRSFGQGAAPAAARGNYLIKNGAVITVDRRRRAAARRRARAQRPHRGGRPRSHGGRRRGHRRHRHDRHAGLRRHALPHVERARTQLRRRRRLRLFPGEERNLEALYGRGLLRQRDARSGRAAPTPASPPCTTGRTTRARRRMPTPNCARTASRCCAPAMPTAMSTRCRATSR